jgi:hypothetical protein
MANARMRRFTGIFALASVLLWLAIFPLYTLGEPSISLYDGAGVARDLFRIHYVVFARILLGMGIMSPCWYSQSGCAT